jgi:gamma-glutamyltranspeptidase/glutathione hydrolase
VRDAKSVNGMTSTQLSYISCRPCFRKAGRFFVLTVLVLLWLQAVCLAAYRQPVYAKHGMVVSAHPLASKVGCDVLKNGGNAVDAAVATAFVLNVVEGYYSGIGGGLFMVIRTPDGKVVTIDGRETAPALCDSFSYMRNPDEDQSVTGPRAGGVPGTLAALDLVLKQYGTMSLAEIMVPAIDIADTGCFIYPKYQEELKANRDRLLKYPQSAAIFLKPDSSIWELGDRLVQPDLARSLRKIATKGADEFYHGNLGQHIAKQIGLAGGWIRMDDLEEYQPVIGEPVHGQYKGYDIYSMPPPSSGGVHLIQMLNMLRRHDLGIMGHNSSQYIHYLVEVMTRAFADRAEYLGDPAFSLVPVKGLISLDYADHLASSIDPVTASHDINPGDPFRYQEGDHTSQVSVIDIRGGMVAMTTTINTAFGSAWVIPGTGILLNDEMDDFVTRPGEANYWGLVGNRRNWIEPGKRPLSSMTPTVVLKDGKPSMILGSPGGPRIITTVLQVFLNVVDFGFDIQAAVDAPRVHHQWMPDTLYIEDGIPVDVLDNLIKMGYNVKAGDTWSAAQCIYRDPNTGLLTGGSDSRSNGSAVGY